MKSEALRSVSRTMRRKAAELRKRRGLARGNVASAAGVVASDATEGSLFLCVIAALFSLAFLY